MNSIKDFLISVQKLQVEYFGKVSISIKTNGTLFSVVISNSNTGDRMYCFYKYNSVSELLAIYNGILTYIKEAS